MSTDKPAITLLISCPDQPGIVAATSRFIFEHNGNILESDQHSTPKRDCTFFMRICFEEEGFALSPSELALAFSPIAVRFHMKWSIHYTHQRNRAVIFVSKFYHCLTTFLWRLKRAELAISFPV